jgi:hypothetical protein
MKIGVLLFLFGLFMLYTTIKKPANKKDTSGLNFNGIFYGGGMIITGIYLIIKHW